MRKFSFVAAIAAFLLSPFAAIAQTAPNWYYGKVPTTAEWAQAWSSKMDYTGSPPCLLTGCVMQGRLVTIAPSGRSGFNLTPGGGAPTNPFDGDLWVTTAGLFVRVNGTTVGPLSAGTGGGVCTNQVMVSITSGVPGCASITNALLSAGTFSSITGVGTLTAGATGAGFTINLGTSTVLGNLTVSHLNSGTGASGTTFWAGDGTWKTPSGSGTVTSVQLTPGVGVAIATTAGSNPITTTGNLTISQSNSMGANKYQVFTTGSGTVTTPTGAAWAEFTLVGAGGGGSGGGTGAGTGGTGGSTCLAASGAACTTPISSAASGTGGNWSTGVGGTGGSTTGTCTQSLNGQNGFPALTGSTATTSGAAGGGSSFFGGGGTGNFGNAAGSGGVAGTGGGGQGGGAGSSTAPGAGGAGGGWCVNFIQNPAASYTYAIGTGGTSGTTGSTGSAGGGGAGGRLIAKYGFN